MSRIDLYPEGSSEITVAKNQKPALFLQRTELMIEQTETAVTCSTFQAIKWIAHDCYFVKVAGALAKSGSYHFSAVVTFLIFSKHIPYTRQLPCKTGKNQVVNFTMHRNIFHSTDANVALCKQAEVGHCRVTEFCQLLAL